MINHQIYQQCLFEYVREAYHNSDKTTRGISEYVANLPKPGRFTRHKDEKAKAIAELTQAFDEHRHWPLDLVIKQLGLDYNKIAAE